MSNVSNRHNLNPFVAGKSEALTGQRLARIGYKKTKDNPNPLASVCVSVPPVNQSAILEQASRLLPYIVGLIEGAQDGIIRSMYEASQGSLSSVSDADISLEACIQYLDAEHNGGRLTGEFIGAWFAANLAENLTVVIADKLRFDLSTEEQCATVERHLNGYKALFVSLAGNKTVLQPNQIQGLRRALDVAASEDATVSRIRARLDVLEKKEKIEDLLEI